MVQLIYSIFLQFNMLFRHQREEEGSGKGNYYLFLVPLSAET